MKVLVTGAAGFIGAHTAQRLVARGDHVVGLDNFDPFYGRAPKERNIAAVRAADPGGRFEFVEGDILDTELLDRVMVRGFDVVLHQAGLAGVRPSIATPWRYQQVNVVGTARVAEAMAKHGVDRMVFASSSSVYGDNEQLPYAEDQRVDLPASPYAASKRACELLLFRLNWKSGSGRLPRNVIRTLLSSRSKKIPEAPKA
jgi:UDP-glucuronate 4-epimerase